MKNENQDQTPEMAGDDLDERAEQLDAFFAGERKPLTDAQQAERYVVWHDATIRANHWFSMPDVGPADAAMLLCQFNPNDHTWDSAVGTTNDETEPADLEELRQQFESLSRAKPGLRTLRDWLRVAQGMKVTYHSWIDVYLGAVALLTPDSPGPAASAERATPAAPLARSETAVVEPAPGGAENKHSEAQLGEKKWTPQRRAELLGEFRAMDGKRPSESGKRGARGALTKLARKADIHRDTAADQLDNAIKEKKAADMWAQLNTAK